MSPVLGISLYLLGGLPVTLVMLHANARDREPLWFPVAALLIFAITLGWPFATAAAILHVAHGQKKRSS